MDRPSPFGPQTLERRRRQGIDVVPERVRQALAESGLSFGELAKGAGVSRQTMHNVASGKARPSAPVLEHIARRTQKTIEFFLAEAVPQQPARQVGEIQILCASRQFPEAVALGESVLERLSNPATVAEVRLCLAEAYGCLGEADKALPHARAARQRFQAR